MRYTPDPADAARRLAGDLAMRLQTPLLPDDPEERLFVIHNDPERFYACSSGEQKHLADCEAIEGIGLRARHKDDNLRRSTASALRRLAEVVEPS